jgi:hypothetical protein
LLNGVPALQSQTSLNNYYSGGAGNLTGTGNKNTANGYAALNSNTTGNNNTANGYSALYSNTTGNNNTANGVQALFYNTTGYNNAANGVQAGLYIANGVTSNQTSSNSLYEGFQAFPLASGDTNENVIGNTAIGHGSNTTTLGNTATVGTYINGILYQNGALNGTSASFSGNVAAGTTNPVTIGGATGSCTGKVAMADGTGCVTNGGAGAVYTFGPGLNGAVCNSSTDDTTAFNALLATVNTAGGGTIQVTGRCLIQGDIVYPNNGDTTNPLQNPIVVEGLGFTANGLWTAPPAAPGALIFSNASTAIARIVSKGGGLMEWRDLEVSDQTDYGTTGGAYGNGVGLFFFVTNTTPYIHDVLFRGRVPNSAQNDGIVLGGTASGVTPGQVLNNNSPFQGYGGGINNNWYVNMRTAVRFQQFSNAVPVMNNTISASSGTGTATVADGCCAFEGVNNVSYMNTGTYFAGNLIEIGRYLYAFRCGTACEGSTFVGNTTWDPASFTLGAYYLQGSNYNTVISAHDDNPSPIGSYVRFGPSIPATTVVISSGITGNNINVIPGLDLSGLISRIDVTTTGVGNQFRAESATPGIQLSNTGTGGIDAKMLSGWTNTHTITWLSASTTDRMDLDMSTGNLLTGGTIGAGAGSSTNHAVCWKAGGVLGYCSAVVDASGVCGTCN